MTGTQGNPRRPQPHDPAQQQPGRRTAGTVAQGLAALLALLALLAGAPLLLLAVAASPLDILPTIDDVRASLTQADPDGSVFIHCLTWVGWAAWASLVIALALEIPAQLRGVRAPRLPGFSVQQQLVGGLVSAVLALIVLPAAANAATPAMPTHTNVVAITTAATPGTGSATDPARAGPTRAAPAADHAGPIHVVEPTQTLWGIAQQHLGDGERWREIARLNYGFRQPDGHALTHTHVLQPGWRLQLPPDATRPAAAHTPTAATHHTVVDGDSLWSIAEQHLGDGDRWPEIARLNRGVRQPDGHTLTRRHVLQPGWTLALPTTPAPTSHRPAAPARTTPAPAAAAHPEAPSIPAPATSPTITTPASATSAPAASTPARQPAAVATSAPTVTSTTATATATATDTNQAGAETSTETGAEDGTIISMRTAAGLGALAAAGLLSVLGAQRVRQQRRRRPGERIPMPADPAAITELELRVVEDPIGVDHIDGALRALAAWCRDHDQALPQLRAARLTPSQLELYLAAPAQLPAPWSSTPEAAVWALSHTDLRRFAGQLHAGADTRAPYPGLVTIGQDTEDAHLLLDLEQIGALAVHADPDQRDATLAALAIELATSRWADDLQVTVVGCLPELAGVLPTGRLRHIDHLERLIRELETRADDVAAILTDAGAPDLPTARGRSLAQDTWTPEIVLLGHPTPDHLHQRLTAVLHRVPRVGIAAITTGGTPVGEWSLQFADGDTATDTAADETAGTALLHPAGITIRPQQLAGTELQAVIEILRTGNDDPIPGPAWAAHMPPEPTLDELHEDLDQAPNDSPAGTEELHDDDRTAPATRSADTTDNSDDEGINEGDVAAVHHLPTDAPLVRVLGPVEVLHARGTEPVTMTDEGRLTSSHVARATELVTFLALHPRGATTEQLLAVLSPARRIKPDSLYAMISRIRRWLGTAPDGTSYLPSRPDNGRYRLSGVTTDWAQFLALVGDDVTTTSLDNLTAALTLVDQQPFADTARGRYSWCEPHRQEMIAAIIDVAHALATRAARAGRLDIARRATAIGRTIDPASELIWRDALRTELIAGDPDGHERIAAELTGLLADLDTDPEPETEQLLDADVPRRAAQ